MTTAQEVQQTPQQRVAKLVEDTIPPNAIDIHEGRWLLTPARKAAEQIASQAGVSPGRVAAIAQRRTLLQLHRAIITEMEAVSANRGWSRLGDAELSELVAGVARRFGQTSHLTHESLAQHYRRLLG